MGIFGSFKDNISSMAAEKYLSQYIQKYGKLLDFQLNSQQKKIDLKVQLLGEVSNVEINIGSYSIIEEQNKSFVKINQISTSREWLNLVLNDYIKGRTFELPEQYAGIIKKAL